MIASILDRLPFGISYLDVIKVRLVFFRAQTCDVRRAEAPVATRTSGHDVKMIVRNFLTAANAVILIEKNAIRLK